MGDRWTLQGPAHVDLLGRLRSRTASLALAAGALAPFALLSLLAPRPIALPLFALFAIAGAAILATLAWIFGARREANEVTLWDASGALAFFGCAAAMLARPENVVRLFDYLIVAP